MLAEVKGKGQEEEVVGCGVGKRSKQGKADVECNRCSSSGSE